MKLICAGRVGGVMVCLLLAATMAGAQDTRAAERERLQAEKAAKLEPNEPDRVERILTRVENNLKVPPRVYAFFGSVYRGGLLAVGPGFRQPFGDTGLADVHAAWSLKNYKVIDASVQLPALAAGRVRSDVHASWLDAPKVAYYGQGSDTTTSSKASYLYRPTTVGASVQLRPVPVSFVGAGYDYLDIDTGPGTLGASIEERFGPVGAPGLGADPTYDVTRAFAGIDWRESAGYSQSGGLYRVDWSDYRVRSGGAFDFRRLDAEVRQFVPLLRGNWVIALRGLVSTTDADSGNVVPYFLMPDLGGSSELRGYPSWRFRDRHRLLLSGEYRWTPGRFLDMALFLDAGKVTDRRADLDLEDLRKSYGIGMRFHAPSATVLRVELARTDEGTALVFAFGPSF